MVKKSELNKLEAYSKLDSLVVELASKYELSTTEIVQILTKKASAVADLLK